MDKPLFKFLALIILAVGAIGAVVVFRPKARTSQNPPNLPELFAATIPTPTPSSIAVFDSPDGSRSLTMRHQKNSDGSVTYTFSVSGADIFTKPVDSSTTFSIPYNTWSPDNKYLFLKESGKDTTSYIVLTSNGTPIKPDFQTIEVTELFVKKYTDYKITDVTGWGDPTLLIVNTDKVSGGQGPSFWLDLTNLSFIQLSDRFN